MLPPIKGNCCIPHWKIYCAWWRISALAVFSVNVGSRCEMKQAWCCKVSFYAPSAAGLRVDANLHASRHTLFSGGLRVDASLLEGDFDPEAWDKQMAVAFGDEYYVSHPQLHSHSDYSEATASA